ncbi:hypothetical protein DPMN_066691 [Dreissena polymorpha]|uniref:DUF6729 domain-containing protein n=1 Tax=Dreissena polymorpha TaxID=45954 RepID=A0A9D3YYD8_DREPO|nr:hypothetical protein DPMN_066691 [Dreissena polymorpha]
MMHRYLSLFSEFQFIECWRAYVPEVDQQWISKALFTYSSKGHPELDERKLDGVWYESPKPQLLPNQKPRLHRCI